ncbi:MAG: helix-turn-helix domain-containing protein [Deltaproteobacteria bacterium]|nr:helix-turn-helix domain-containing protein [Deltaproteobacteria bacterium]
MRQIDYLKVENKILRSHITSQIRLSPSEKRKILKYGLALGKSVRHFINVVDYSTFRRWVRYDVKGYIRKPRQRGRKRTPEQIRQLVVRLAKENNWGYTRILGELKKLEIVSLSRNTIKNILREHGLDPAPERSRDTWDSYIKRHFKALWACDFFTKTA